jgi:hypothetical protein
MIVEPAEPRGTMATLRIPLTEAENPDHAGGRRLFGRRSVKDLSLRPSYDRVGGSFDE